MIRFADAEVKKAPDAAPHAPKPPDVATVAVAAAPPAKRGRPRKDTKAG